MDHTAKVRIEDVVAGHKHEFVLDLALDGQQRVGQPLLFELVRVGHRNAVVLVAVVVDDALFPVPYDGHQFLGTEFDQPVETVG